MFVYEGEGFKEPIIDKGQHVSILKVTLVKKKMPCSKVLKTSFCRLGFGFFSASLLSTFSKLRVR